MGAPHFADWFDAHHEQLLHLARRLVGPELAEDVVQEAWVNAWRARGRYRGEARPSSWLYRITFNAAMSQHRRRRNREGREDAIELVIDRPTEDPSPFVSATTAEQRRLLARAFPQLPPHERVAIGFALDGLTCREVAIALGIPENTVKTRTARGRQRLAALLAAPHTSPPR